MYRHGSTSCAESLRSSRKDNVTRARALVIMLLVTGLIHGGCAARAEEESADRSFLTGTPCAPPCWHNLEIDKSTSVEVSETLQRLSFIDSGTIREWGTVRWDGQEGTEIVFGCRQPEMEHCGSVILSEGVLRSVHIAVGYHLTFAEAVQRLGQPSFMAYIPLPGESVGCDVVLIWPNSRIALSSRSSAGCPTTAEIAGGARPYPDTEVSEITYGLPQATWIDVGEGTPYLHWPGFAEP